MEAAVNISKPGYFVVPFAQTCSSAHGEIVALQIPAEVLHGKTVTQLLTGLKATLEIADKSSTISESEESSIPAGEDISNGAIPIFRLAPFRKGIYDARVTVITGAPALEGITQRLEGRYLLCGMEQMPATIATVLAVVSLAIGAIVGLLGFFR